MASADRSNIDKPVRDCGSVLARFAEDAALVVDLAAKSDGFCTLCEEHALATEALQHCSRSPVGSDPTFFEYLGIIRELELEIVVALANEKRSLRPLQGDAPKRGATF